MPPLSPRDTAPTSFILALFIPVLSLLIVIVAVDVTALQHQLRGDDMEKQCPSYLPQTLRFEQTRESAAAELAGDAIMPGAELEARSILPELEGGADVEMVGAWEADGTQSKT
jgi:hypothetical protein